MPSERGNKHGEVSFCESLCCPFILGTFKNGEKGFSSPGTCSSCGKHLLWSLCLPTFLVYLSLKGHNCFIRNLTKPRSIPSYKLFISNGYEFLSTREHGTHSVGYCVLSLSLPECTNLYAFFLAWAFQFGYTLNRCHSLKP